MKFIPRDCYPHIEDRDAHQILVAHLVFLGTNHLLAEDKVNVLIACIVAQVQTAYYFESILFYETAPGVQSKLRDLWQGGERDIVKFFHKRNGCTCLKERYERLRNEAKVGTCSFLQTL